MALQGNDITMHKSVSGSFALASNEIRIIKINKVGMKRQRNRLDQVR